MNNISLLSLLQYEREQINRIKIYQEQIKELKSSKISLSNEYLQELLTKYENYIKESEERLLTTRQEIKQQLAFYMKGE